MGNEIFGNSHQAGGSTCRIKIGSYTGDGTTGQAITGVGFKPKMVFITDRPSGIDDHNLYLKYSDNWGDYSLLLNTDLISLSSCINSLDSDGFTVDSSGVDSDPNTDGTTYDYAALG